jgi:hypothetical protein
MKRIGRRVSSLGELKKLVRCFISPACERGRAADIDLWHGGALGRWRRFGMLKVRDDPLLGWLGRNAGEAWADMEISKENQSGYLRFQILLNQNLN